MKTLKLIFSFLLVSLLSASVAIGTYSYLNLKNGDYSSDVFSSRQELRAVSYATPAENTDFTYAAEQSVNAVVHIKITPRQSERGRGYRDPLEFFFGDRGSQYQVRPRFGSGVIVSADGYVVTNNHVIEGASEIEVKSNDDQVYKAKFIGGDALTDVALLKIEGKDLHALSFGDSDQLKVGEWVLAVGNPFNLTSTVTAGIVSAKGRSDVMASYGSRDSQQNIQSYIQTDAAVNPGNSGGALVNTKGELIGINTAILSQTGSFAGHSFAIPSNIVKKVVSDIRQYGIVQRAMLGISVADGDLSVLKEREPDKYGKIKINDGIYISGFLNSTAQKAGLQEGDVVTAIDGKKVKNLSELKGLLSGYSPGNKVDVQVYRNNATRNFTVELKNDLGTTEIVKQNILGAVFKELSNEVKERLGINYGVEVTELVDNGKMSAAGVRNGFIILAADEKRISSSADLDTVVTAVLKKENDNRGLLIRGFYPNNNRRIIYYAINLSD